MNELDNLWHPEKMLEVQLKELVAAGGSSSDVVKVRVFLTDINDRTIINPKRIEYFGEHKPASTLLEISAFLIVSTPFRCPKFLPFPFFLPHLPLPSMIKAIWLSLFISG